MRAHPRRAIRIRRFRPCKGGAAHARSRCEPRDGGAAADREPAEQTTWAVTQLTTSGSRVCCVLATFALLVPAPPVFATYPGRNGRLVFEAPSGVPAGGTVIATDAGPLTSVVANENDRSPVPPPRPPRAPPPPSPRPPSRPPPASPRRSRCRPPRRAPRAPRPRARRPRARRPAPPCSHAVPARSAGVGPRLRRAPRCSSAAAICRGSGRGGRRPGLRLR